MKTTDHKARIWVVVVSREHALRGKEEGFIQACHGKKAPVAKMKKGDWVLIYSSKEKFDEKKVCRRFTTIGRVVDDEAFSFQMSKDFCPYRRKVEYLNAEETEILPLVQSLDFIKNKNSWGYPFRWGILEIGDKDFELIAKRMGVDV
ncbi:EVE domain-containing protein [Leptospira perolatii]|uniref:UPF0310 protein CH360_09965 n=1 Tax=Leptospira perolatii TaxID=2023191 RepID=A0A2M9ZND6_9LEPT|nr:EVE domain-containing protein [Leptospira perolatii]PJZ69603.1 EVE domain-containing protein [Leptospira perolatii]PJZ73590.1 EVE domain-containing protein [Leptospira perolatii]